MGSAQPDFDPSGGGLIPAPKPASKLPLVREALVGAARLGMTVDDAARLVGIAPKTLKAWLMRGSGEDTEPPTPEQEDLFIAWEQAVAMFLREQLENVNACARGTRTTTLDKLSTPEGETVREVVTEKPDWKASAFLLERLAPEKFGPKRRPEQEEKNRTQRRRVLVLGEVDESCIVSARVVDATVTREEGGRPKLGLRPHQTDDATGLPDPGGAPDGA